MGLVVVIPAYNASRHLPDVVARVARVARACDLRRIVVVDDGSTDDTAASVRALVSTSTGSCPVALVERPRNGGYGAAMKDGLRLARQDDPDVVACVHADGQYSPEALPALLGDLRARGLDLLQGSRIASGTARSGGMPLVQKIAANAVLNRLENWTLGLGLTDYHSGYLLYSRRALALPFDLLSSSFDFDLEVIATARAHGLAVGEAPVPTRYADEESHLQPIPYGLRVLRVLWNYRRGHYDPI